MSFQVREVGTVEGDGSFIVSVFDAVIPFLESIGSNEQWGTTLFSHRDGFTEETLQQVRQSEQLSLTDKKNDENDGLRIFIVERELTDDPLDETSSPTPLRVHVAADGRRLLSVGFAFVREDWVPRYIASQPHLCVERTDTIYLEVIITDSRVDSSLRHGAGAALLREIQKYGHARQKRVIYLDGWAGNQKKLVRYYEQQGFQAIDDFSLPRADKAPWLGTLMRMNI
ncbi:hypothetical protein ASPZODRAFT_128303 [Penicilliopsis zonata CBS 506.65]|uniref:N-acetyltransferase domain-containing protein n=1 Tax=Penicilliopsis zonata CBS 506.65 TaxID=1073090 RepID=A0A1L9SRM6_9EURO|nr:hypothetical protein ASPZODRAFT_128303 [Penicilliopsis zonata CBS 506.65]OJJ49774.1 hypothetical protein ASPZODRAFT_128303 [Penicilliopsis zonata CBS 506.65]